MSARSWVEGTAGGSFMVNDLSCRHQEAFESYTLLHFMLYLFDSDLLLLKIAHEDRSQTWCPPWGLNESSPEGLQKPWAGRSQTTMDKQSRREHSVPSYYRDTRLYFWSVGQKGFHARAVQRRQRLRVAMSSSREVFLLESLSGM